jgi:hypothetical protein
MAGKHIPCTLNRNDCNKHKPIGCKTHGRTRQGSKKDLFIFGIYEHCWCGLDLASKYIGQGEWKYEVYEKGFCTPENHYTEKPCYHNGENCGWHGLKFNHCRLCKQPLAEVSLVQRILNALKPS